MYFLFYLLAVCGQQTEIMEMWAQLLLSININDIDNSLGSECRVSYNLEWLSLLESQLNSFFSGLRELELETPELTSSVSPEILSERFSLQDAGLTSDQASIFTLTAESQRLGRRQLELSNNDLSSVSAELVARAVMRLEMVNLEQCHLLLSQMVTVFNLITESEHLQLRHRQEIMTPFIDSKA